MGVSVSLMCGGVLCRELERLEREQMEKEAEEMRRRVSPQSVCDVVVDDSERDLPP